MPRTTNLLPCARRASLALIALTSLVGAAHAQPAGPAAPSQPQSHAPAPRVPTLQLVSPRVNFGVNKPLAFVNEQMTLMNSGDKPITIARAIGECSCTDATILGNDHVLDPGEQLDILFAVEFPRTMGLQTKHVLVYEEGNETPYMVPFDFEVGYPIRVNGGAQFAIIIDPVGEFVVDSVEGKPFKVISINGAEPGYNGYDPKTQWPQSKYTLTYNWTKLSQNEIPRWVVVETDLPDAEMVVFPARVPNHQPITDRRQWAAMDEFIATGPISAEQPSHVTMLFSGRAPKPGKQLSVTSTNPNVGVRIINARQPDRGGGMQVDFEITPNAGATGYQATVVNIVYDDVKTAFDLFCRFTPGAAPAKP